MLSAGTIRWIKRLDQNGLSKRAISQATGVARNTVADILNLDRTDHDVPASLYDVDDPIFTEPPGRCPGCGAFVHMPCLACSLRANAPSKPK